MPHLYDLPAAEQLDRLRVKVTLSREQAVTLAKWAEPHEVPAIWDAIRQYDCDAAYLKGVASWEAKDAAKKQALLDADVPLLGDAIKCQASVAYPGRWPSFHRCIHTATVRRPKYDEKGDLALCGQHRKSANTSRYYTSRHG
jgi:hypothetical protein